ncbi:hypothetical protein [Xenorhabdus szentirmaii]|uniref:Uncharacterized protein n=2 Tax=Xenorhabdus szentirmaii TaxID=290112 RepID=W1IVJ8_9GAMM|nr:MULTISPECIES: hypothetical protein [Xenorhabdus]MBD2803000.1 hypothetical protein [Xenorhabdus sp. M]PHM43432.1 hypothetical protein Xszus_03221 [Xenorhabdus szentirmaii]CDL81250.1 conserved hypothetical protein [Xenorhabdus szentirmaii DSM 16338]
MDKIAIYSDMLNRALSYIRDIQSSSALRKAFDKTCYQEAELLHDIVKSLIQPEMTEHDVFFLNDHAKYYLENANPKLHYNYNSHKENIILLFKLVPDHLRDQLEWPGPQ